jgi:glycosyltransferase involved in cell wall biosynthesis
MNSIYEPQLSIVVLTYNRHHLLRDCLQSLLEQNIAAQEVELVVADDGSTDATCQVVEEVRRRCSRLVYVRQPHKGIAATRNLGIRHASGRLVAIVADDYLFSPDYASTVIRFFEEKPHAEIVRFKIVASRDDIFSRLSHFYYEISIMNQLLRQPELKSNFEKLIRYFKRLPVPKTQITTEHNLVAAGAAAFRRSVFDRAGLFDEALLRGEDTDYTRRLKALGILVYYNPFHEVRHHYSWGCLDTLQKNFAHGVNHYRLYRKHAGAPSLPQLVSGASHALTHQFLQAIWRARQVQRTWQFFLYFPALLAFEMSFKAGMCWGFFKSLVCRNGRKD